MRDVVFVRRDTWEAARNKRIAVEVGKINKALEAEGRPYLLIGPGRWGTADPWLGIPVSWSQISGVRVLVEASPEGYAVEPSQGTHFFQNITSLRIGYLTIPPGAEKATAAPGTAGEYVDWDWLDSRQARSETEHLRGVRVPPWMATALDAMTTVGAASALSADYLKDIMPTERFSMLPTFSGGISNSPTGFLTYDYDDPERDDDQWLFLPALSRTKRIASSDKSGSFMGSDFSYADMSDRPIEHWDYELMGESEIDGHAVWQIQGIPITEREKDETGYEKMISFVRKDNYVVVRSLSWLKKGDRLKYMDVTKLEEIDGIWVATEIQVTTKKGKATQHKTVMRSHDVRFDQDLDEDLFSVRQLEKGL